MKHALQPSSIGAPFAQYSHGIATPLPGGGTLVATSGQLGMAKDGTIPADTRGQADICFANAGAILAEAGMGPEDVIRINAFVTDRAHMAAYMAARDAWIAGVTPPPASTLVIVSGFTKPEFTVEVEILAIRHP